MVKKVNHIELKKIIEQYYKTKIALFIWGRFGIGKSAVVRDVAIDIAKNKNREFVEWNKLTTADRDGVFKNPEKYFCLIDIRLSEYDSSDIKGLPNFKNDKESIEWKVPYWAKLLEKENSDGILFFDEINLASPLVISSCYKIIYDRIINEGKINNNWLIIGAGNTEEDRAYTHDVASPLRDRGGEVELVGSDIENWTNWATNNKIDIRIIGFLNFKSSNLYKVNYEDGQKYTTYRGWERVSKLIENINDYETLSLIVSSAIGEGVAYEFVAFCRLQEKLNLDEIIKNPKKINELKNIDEKYFLICAVADKYKDDKIKIDRIFEISEILDKMNNAELVVLMWRLCKSYKDKFRDDFKKIKNMEMISKYLKYIES